MKMLRAMLLTLTLVTCAAAQSQMKCFQNAGLKGTDTVNLELSGAKLTGTYSVERDGSTETYAFNGTRSGNTLNVKFAGNKAPDVSPSEMKSFVWTLSKSGGQETMRVKFYGKNYQTNKYADYFADFALCQQEESGHAALLKTAERARFARGATSSTMPLSFQNMTERKVFSISVRQGQTLEIGASGCAIEVYTPDGKIHQYVEWENGAEKTYATSTIDAMTIKPLPQTGDYLIVLQKMAENAMPESVTFKVTN